MFPPRLPAVFSKRGKLSHDKEGKGKTGCCESTDIQLSLTQGTSTGASWQEEMSLHASRVPQLL